MSRAQLTRPEFFALCEHLRALRDWIANARPTKVALCAALAKKIGKDEVADSCLNDAMEATGIVMPDRSGGKPNQGSNHLRVTIKALLDLYQMLGQVPPLSLLDTYQKMNAGRIVKSFQSLLPLGSDSAALAPAK